MRSKLIFAIILAITIFNSPQKTYAQQRASKSSATIQNPQIESGSDSRVKILSDYLASQGSPLVAYSKDFVYYADKYDLDWRLVPAITGVESSFGKEIPPYSYNGWGWGVYGDNVARFSSWSEGIAVISEGLRERYMDEWGKKDVYEIGSVYAASPTWAARVSYIMNDIARYAL